MTHPFQPIINTQRSTSVKNANRSRSIMSQKSKKHENTENKFNFQPKICRPPKHQYRPENEDVWTYLYKSKTPKKHDQTDLEIELTLSSPKSNKLFSNLKTTKYRQIFDKLNPDHFGMITANRIVVENIDP